MSTSVLRTADAWRVATPTGASKARPNPKYLADGDVVEATAATDDGATDLGRRRMIVRDAR